MVEVARLQARLVERELELAEQRKEAESFLRELQESVECPVCFSIPRAPPVPCCQNGHVICAKCKEKVEVCPTCRVTMTNCVSQVLLRAGKDLLSPLNSGGSHDNPEDTTSLRLAGRRLP